MAGIVADYRVIIDREFALEQGGDIDRDFEFELPGKLRRDQPSLISFMLRSLLSDLAQLGIIIAGTPVYESVHAEGFRFCVQVVIKEQILVTPRNTITFFLSTGGVRLSDVVIWFQRA
jgi:hypothetical protein